MPTPVLSQGKPDLKALISSAKIIGKYIKKGTIVILESTVWPEGTINSFGAIISETSNFEEGLDYGLAQVPESKSRRQ